MRPSKASVLTLMCLAFLAMQISGLHGHIRVIDGEAAEYQGTHTHETGANGHAIDEVIDIPLDLRTVWVKSMPFLLFMVFGLLSASALVRTTWPGPPEQLNRRGQTRWRPPLRAPPVRVLNIF